MSEETLPPGWATAAIGSAADRRRSSRFRGIEQRLQLGANEKAPFIFSASSRSWRGPRAVARAPQSSGRKAEMTNGAVGEKQIVRTP